MHVAVVDIGSNTTKILIAKKNALGQLTSIAEKSLPCRLAQGIGKDQSFASESMVNMVINRIGELLEFSRSFSPTTIRVVATEALRRLENSEFITNRIQKKFNFSVEILTGEQEAGYIAKGLMTDPSIAKLENFDAIDLGGGSLEIMRITDGTPENVVSLPLGAVVLSEKFLGDLTAPPSPTCILALEKYVRNLLRSQASFLMEKSTFLAGTGGSIIFLRKLICSCKEVEFSAQSMLCISDVSRLSRVLNAMNLMERVSEFPELPSDRADVFPAAIIVILELMKFLNLERLTHSFHNLRYGLAQECLSL